MCSLPLRPLTYTIESTVAQIEQLVSTILEAKNQNPQVDTINWEREIDKLVYKLYGLTEEEIKIIENNSKDQIKGEPCPIN